MDTKQVIVIRKDLKMRRGKECAQSGHAALAFLTRRLHSYGDGEYKVQLNQAEQAWIDSSFAKICLQVNSEQELLDIEAKALAAGIECHMVIDAGRTEFNGVPTRTCLALGPDFVDKIDAITGGLKLY